MAKQPKHRLHHKFPGAKRVIVECDLSLCLHCGSVFRPRKSRHSREHARTLDGPALCPAEAKSEPVRLAAIRANTTTRAGSC
jgi:hypothetical protein